ncbi:hypothetical protein KAR91_61025 [Candidatus Pacearchaeota archaeon]|nr:hypothetical protein [Candidatus Pacearchaeota archaeon]
MTDQEKADIVKWKLLGKEYCPECKTGHHPRHMVNVGHIVSKHKRICRECKSGLIRKFLAAKSASDRGDI